MEKATICFLASLEYFNAEEQNINLDPMKFELFNNSKKYYELFGNTSFQKSVGTMIESKLLKWPQLIDVTIVFGKKIKKDSLSNLAISSLSKMNQILYIFVNSLWLVKDNSVNNAETAQELITYSKKLDQLIRQILIKIGSMLI